MPLPRSRTFTKLGPLVLGAVAVLAGSACGDSAGPAGLTGTYLLVSAGDGTLPYTFFAGLACSRTIAGGKLEFRGNARLLDIRDYQTVCAAGSEPVDPDTLVQAYRLEGDRLIVSRTQAGGAQAYSDTGFVQADFITLNVRDIQELRSRNVTMVYQKL